MTSVFKGICNKLVTLIITLFLVSTVAVAQGDTGNDPDFPDVPLDGGLSLLLAAGVAFGGKKIYNYRKSNKENKTV
jgi:hypothetical protein